MADTTAQLIATAAPYLKEAIAAVGDPRPYYGLLSLKGLELVMGTAHALVTKTIDAQKLKAVPGDVLLTVLLIGTALSLQAVNQMFEPVAALVFVYLAGSNAVSVLKNATLCYTATGRTPPDGLLRMASLINQIENHSLAPQAIVATVAAQVGVTGQALDELNAAAAALPTPAPPTPAATAQDG
jgi:hypothetical protein